MTSKQSVSALLFTIYCILFFSLSTLFYFLSIYTGGNGLAIAMFGGGDDGAFYYEQALNIVKGQPAILTSIHALILGWILKFFQTDEVFLLRAFNFIGNVLTLFVGLKVVSILQGEKKILSAKVIFTVLLAYYPSFLLNSNLSIIRDTWIIFYYLLSLLLLLNVLRLKHIPYKLANFVLLFISLWLLFGYRKYAVLGFVVASILYFIFFHFKRNRKALKRVVAVLFIGFSIVYTFLQSFKFPIVQLSIKDILLYRSNAMDIYAGGSQMNISLDKSNVILFYLNYFYSVISNAVGPFPWQFTGVSSIILFFAESLLFIFILWKLYKCRASFGKFDYFIIIHSIIWFMLIGIFNDNIGTASRLRMVGWIPLFVVFAKIYAEQLMLKKSSRKEDVVRE